MTVTLLAWSFFRDPQTLAECSSPSVRAFCACSFKRLSLLPRTSTAMALWTPIDSPNSFGCGSGSPGSCGSEADFSTSTAVAQMPRSHPRPTVTPAQAHGGGASSIADEDEAVRKRCHKGRLDGARVVRFHPETKAHDGLKLSSEVFQEYMKDVFRVNALPAGKQTTVARIARSLNVPGLLALRLMLVDLMERCKSSPNGRAPVLPHGGGTAGCVLLTHMPYLASHVEYLDVVVSKVHVVVERRAQEKLAQEQRQQQHHHRQEPEQLLLQQQQQHATESTESQQQQEQQICP
jgi:hypothetical protein